MANTPLIHRDISWLQFNDRVLAEARQSTNPLLERAKFLAISSSNLDEFFMIRFSSLGRSIAAQGRSDPRGARRLMRIRASILETVAKFVAKQVEALDLLTAELEAAGIHVVRRPRPEDPAFAAGKEVFEQQILPKLLPPEAFSIAKLGHLESQQLSVLFPGDIWFRIPRAIPTVLFTRVDVGGRTGGIHFFFLDDLLASHLGTAFRLDGAPGFLRITRDGDFTVDLEEEDTESIPDVVRSGLGTREQGRPVRLQYSGELKPSLLTQCLPGLRLVPGQIQPAPGTLCLHGLWTMVNQMPEDIASKPGLKYPPLEARIPKPLRNLDQIFDHLRREDILLHHPYDSFDAFVAWIQAACADPAVTMIEQTVYRMDALSPVIEALKAAAPHKKVRVMIELRARFDELNNLRLADELRKAGIEVAFGFGKLKLHAKIASVTRQEEGGPRLYTHLSTGNYNAATARQYTDLAILTANPEIGQDARHFFDAVWQGQIPTSFKHLVSAPAQLRRKLLRHIQAETEAAQAGRKARIVAKVNALVDDSLVEQLYRASNAGVQVDLIVRGACSLVPGVHGLSENIRVISVVDRFLEHSRIYYFGDSKVMYLSSADWMPRNFFSRLEIAFPVLDSNIFRYLEEVLIPAYLADNAKARELTAQGTWRKRTPHQNVRDTAVNPLFKKRQTRSQFFFEELAASEYRGTPLE